MDGLGVGPSLVGSSTPLSADNRKTLEDINDALRQDYALRRRMMLERLDLTVQSFLWSDAAQVCSRGFLFVHMCVFVR